MWAQQQRGIHVDQAELLCKDGCGYYGNPAWQGYCSKCWRERTRKSQGNRQENGVHSNNSTFGSEGGSSLTFSKFEEKKNNEKGRRVNTMRRLLWGTPSPPKRPGESSEGQEALKAYQSLEPGDFTSFLKLLRKPSSQRLQSRCTAFLNTMEAYHVMADPAVCLLLTRLSAVVQENAELVIRLWLWGSRKAVSYGKMQTTPLEGLNRACAHRKGREGN
ncbi:hypothetical protein JZ751_018369 [Albula glossodonta]|uniref:A20-type domain-containing protein n=1 Tax=Albula glossodonta TaxID=121402 RepID=A0A8T2MUJ3_9TELE|nr:hypothetical protein JZ751_018369 [Albula glossodonta]